MQTANEAVKGRNGKAATVLCKTSKMRKSNNLIQYTVFKHVKQSAL